MPFTKDLSRYLLAEPLVLARLEATALIALAFVLPLFEAPKNILWIAFAAIWLSNRLRTRDFGGAWDRWDTLIVLWIASAWASAAFAGIRGAEWHATADIVRYASVLWMLKRSRYSEETHIALLGAIVAGTAVGLVWGYYGVLVTKQHSALGLHSVGHVNHSAMYLAVVFGVAFAAVLAWWRRAEVLRRVLGVSVLIFLGVSLMWMESRAAVGAAFLTAVLVACVRAVRLRRVPYVMAAVGAVLVSAIVVLQPEVVEKNIKYTQANDVLNGRDLIWRGGLAAWREFPIFGVGMDNFGRIRDNDLESWSRKRGETFDRQAVILAPHGHSLYVNSLVERGITGLGAILAVLAAWAVLLMARVPEAQAPPLIWAYWGGSCAAWTVTAVAGLLNTTLHHEQALLDMLLLGAWLSLSGGFRPDSMGLAGSWGKR